MTRQIAIPAKTLPPQVRPPAAAGQSGAEFSVKDIIGILRRRMWMIIIITLLAIIISAGLFVLCLVKYPKYTSVGYIRSKMPSDIGLTMRVNMPRKDVLEFAAASNAAVIEGEKFASDLLNRLPVKQTTWYTKRSHDPAQMQLDMQDDLRASSMRNSDLVRVSMQASKSEDARIIVDEAIDQFVNNISTSQSGVLRENLTSLREQRDKFETEKKQKQQRLTELMATEDGWQPGKQNLVYQKMNIMQQELIGLNAEIRRLTMEKNRMRAELQEYGVSAEILTAVESDPEVAGLRTQLMNLKQGAEVLLNNLGEEHRQVKDMQSRIQSVEQALENRQSRLQNQYVQQMLNNIDQQLAQYNEMYKEVSSQYTNLSAEQRNLEEKAVLFEQLNEEIKNLDKRIEEVSSHIYNVQIEQNDPDRVTAEIAQKGSEPLEISFPKLPIFLAGGIILGLMLALGTAFLVEMVDDSIKTPADVTRMLNLPLIGMVPEYEDDDIEVARVTQQRPNELVSEFYRQVRTNLFFSAPSNELKTVFVTSSAAGCGKTTTVVNLGITFAQEGKRVLLVDANFRRPAINRLFPAEGAGRGLSNVLIGQASVSDVVRRSGIEGVDIIDSGPLPPSPSDLLHSQRMRDLMESQKQYYDYIFVDGPPTMVMADARILAGLVDGTVMVVRAQVTPRGAVQRVIRELKVGDNRILGVLLNRVKARKGGYFNKVYQSYYDYINVEPAVAGKLPDQTQAKT